jgi:3D (Asp-Asp-Asp) domain-containing protein
MTQRQISSLIAQADAAGLKSAQLARATAAGSNRSAVPSGIAPAATTLGSTAPGAGRRTITVSATGYALSGRTATGLPVGWGVIAVDPSVIPLGTHMTIPGYGEAVAADTGGGVIGATIDLWFPTVAQANAWGRRAVTITLH